MSSINTLSEVPTRVDELPPDLLAMRTSNAEKGVNILAQTPSRPFSYREDETVYAKFTPKRKILITAIVSFGGLGVNLAALLVLSALPEVAAAFNTTGTIINYSNALFLLIMGIGVLFWGPISQVYGRKWGIAASSILWNMQVLLTPVRYVINPRFNLTSPLQSGFFFLAPGAGYLAGTFVGGPYADYTVKKWIKKRGRRVPEDRLRSAFVAMGEQLLH
ncbi:Dityrosine transporter 1 [Colletotrichum sp. SAR11_57]|nr:Dityrosine transporter 1 [Colletotrichum sp. SAR11_57]